MPSLLDESIQFLKGVGPARAADFARLGILTLRDLLHTYPRDLSDRRNIIPIADARDGMDAVLSVRVLDARQKTLRGGRVHTITTVLGTDDTGEVEAVWFNSPWILDAFDGGEVLLFGKVKREGRRVRMQHPQYEFVSGVRGANNALHMGRIVPIYPCTGKLNQSVWRRVMTHALEVGAPLLAESLPDSLRVARGLMGRAAAVRAMHFPPDAETGQAARARLLYEEAFLLQLAIAVRRRHALHDHPGRAFRIPPEVQRRIVKLLTFRLTKGQLRCVQEIFDDMRASRPMHRLLQGDVGSGKTVVAFFAMLAAVAERAQVCCMAPTTLLARQHAASIRAMLANSDRASVRVVLLAGGLGAGDRARIKAEIASGAADIIIATHAAISGDIVFHDLGLVVIDEQHKFGVHQRGALMAKGGRPDTLVMTATPIPRSLALTVYGDLDVSILNDMPPGRMPVKTSVVGPERKGDVWSFFRREVRAGRQGYVVSPLLEGSETLDVESATEAYASLGVEGLSDCRLGLLHGKMRKEEQDGVMERFRSGGIDVLVCTVVVEVGVDVPNATLMAVLHAERFGLAQLHQLRGRVGRGAAQGHCILVNEARTEEAQRRLAVLARTTDGFEIAEEDLAIRGPGEFLGTRQHGLPDMKLVDIVRDFAILKEARQEARAVLEADPALKAHPVLREEWRRLMARHGAAPEGGSGVPEPQG